LKRSHNSRAPAPLLPAVLALIAIGFRALMFLTLAIYLGALLALRGRSGSTSAATSPY